MARTLQYKADGIAPAACMESVAPRMSVAVCDHVLETSNLRMQVVERSDLANYIELLDDPEVLRYIGVEAGKPLSRAEVEDIVEGAVKGWALRGYGRWTVFERASEEFVGFIGFRCEKGIPELLSVIKEKYWGSGYAFEGARRCIDHGFENLGFTQVCAYARPENVRARAMLGRLNAEFQGIVNFHGVDGAEYLITRS